MPIIFDERDWFEQGLDPRPTLEEVTRLLWEMGLNEDIELVASPRLYDLVQDTDYMKLRMRGAAPIQEDNRRNE